MPTESDANPPPGKSLSPAMVAADIAACVRFFSRMPVPQVSAEDHLDRMPEFSRAAWALPGLELLMDEPERKRELWQAMRRVRQRWLAAN